MSLPTILRNAFHSYQKAATDIQTCLNISSLWKKPARYWFGVHYCKTTNQIIWEGVISPRDEPEYEVFATFEGGNQMTVGQLLVDLQGLLHDETDLVMGEESIGYLDCLVIDFTDESIVVNN